VSKPPSEGDPIGSGRPSRLGNFPRWRLWVGALALLGGVLLLLTPLASWVQDEWRQRQLGSAFATERAAGAEPPAPVATPDPGAPAEPATAAEPSPVVAAQSTPAPMAQAPQSTAPLPVRLEIPKLDISYMVMPDIEDGLLRQGPGHYPQTPLPGAGGNAAIAGHRTIKGRPAYFYSLNKLQPGDPIRVVLADRELTYVVERVYLTSPYDIGVLGATSEPTLTLTTCDPPGLDDQRLIVRARLQSAA
jgi:sortase A